MPSPSPSRRGPARFAETARGRAPRLPARLRPGATPALVAALCTSLLGGACALTTPHHVESRFAPADVIEQPMAVIVSAPVDARPFTDASNRAPVPSVQGDPSDTTLTSRTVGRRLSTRSMLGPNVTLPPGESVAAWVRHAVVDGLRQAGVRAGPAVAAPAHEVESLPRLDVTIRQFWLDVKPGRNLAVVEYRAEIEILGDWPRFGEGRIVQTQGTVSAAALDMTLWRRTFDRALAEIARETARAAGGSGATPPTP
jgi:hypothetical protein